MEQQLIIDKTDLSINIGNLSLNNPIIAASGTFGYADELEEFVDYQNIGAVITKGITLHPREGNPHPRIGEVKNGMINSIGLENIGITKFIDTKLPILQDKKIKFIVNIAGFSINEYVELAQISQTNNIEAIEVNLSCPNVEHGCLEFAKDKELLYRVVNSVRNVFEGTLIVKLSPNTSNPSELALSAQKAGADAISAINTVKAIKLYSKIQNGKIIHSKIKGGMSGPAIKPIALAFIDEIYKAIDIPIIGMGGISNINDIIDFMAVGSKAVQIGTANFTNPNIINKLSDDLKSIINQNNLYSLKNLIGE